MNLKVGDSFVSSAGTTRTIIDIKDNQVRYHRGNPNMWYNLPIGAFIRAYAMPCTDVAKPLDQAFKQLDIKLCSHLNVREDRYFSAMIYKTCKDCGANLN